MRISFRIRRKPSAPPPTIDYSIARQRAIERLGDRYLLAKPINEKPHAPAKEHNS